MSGEVRGKRWNRERTTYVCVDGVCVLVPNRVVAPPQGDQDGETGQTAFASGINYEPDEPEVSVWLLVSKTVFSRDMTEIVVHVKGVKTITFPNTTREVWEGAFSCTAIRSAVLNEGLEVLGADRGYECPGAFSFTPLRRVVFPASLRFVNDGTFRECKKLRRVEFREESRLEKMGARCFCCTGIESVVIPSGVTSIEDAFEGCGALKLMSFQAGSRLERIESTCF